MAQSTALLRGVNVGRGPRVSMAGFQALPKEPGTAVPVIVVTGEALSMAAAGDPFESAQLFTAGLWQQGCLVPGALTSANCQEALLEIAVLDADLAALGDPEAAAVLLDDGARGLAVPVRPREEVREADAARFRRGPGSHAARNETSRGSARASERAGG